MCLISCLLDYHSTFKLYAISYDIVFETLNFHLFDLVYFDDLLDRHHCFKFCVTTKTKGGQVYLTFVTVL